MSDIAREVRKQTNKQFNLNGGFIVESGKAFTGKGKAYGMYVLEDTTFTTLTDVGLVSGSGSYPITLLAGTELYGEFTEVVVSGGTVKLYLE